MKHFVISAVLFTLCLALPVSMSAKNKKPVASELSNMNRIFIGWVDLNPSAYGIYGYHSKEEWSAAIDKANADFVHSCQSKYLSGHSVTGAKSKDDENTEGNDLYVKIDEVTLDEYYVLHLSAHLIDIKRNQDIATIANMRYRGRVCALEGCITKELDQFGEDLQTLIAGGQVKRK